MVRLGGAIRSSLGWGAQREEFNADELCGLAEKPLSALTSGATISGLGLEGRDGPITAIFSRVVDARATCATPNYR